MRRWGAAALLTLTVAACTKPVAGPATLPPLTPSPVASTPPATAITSPSASETPATPVGSASTSTESNGAPSSPATLASGDRSESAAIAAAKNAVRAIYRVSQTLDLSEFNAISYEHCNYRSRMTSVVFDLKAQHSRVVGQLPSDMRPTVLSHTGDVVRVGLAVVVPPHDTVTSTGKVTDKLPGYNIGFVLQMNYIGDRWLLYFVEENPK